MLRQLGRSGLEVSAMGMGCWAIGGPWDMNGSAAGWGEVEDAESMRALEAAYDHGVTFYDTAANYGAGHSEVVLGKTFADRRDKVVIATKFGYCVDEAGKSVTEYKEVVPTIQPDCEASLRRLGSDYIDLYQFHINGYPPEQAAAVRDKLEDLVAQGKIRYYGWSTDNATGARVFAQGEHCVSVQNNMNVIHDAPKIIAVCDEFNLASINRGPLGMGLLTGKYSRDTTWASNDVRSAAGWFKEGFIGPIFDNLEAIREVLTSGGRTLAQGALAWLWARSEHTLPIPGIRTVAQAEENAAAMTFGPLTAEQMAQIETLLGRA